MPVRPASSDPTALRSALRSAVLPAALAAVLSGPAAAQSAPPRAAWIDVEGAWTDFSRNDLRKPNDASGDPFSARDFGADRTTAFRVAGEATVPFWGDDHRFRITWAPLSVDGTASPAAPIRFEGARFAAGTPTTLDWRFDTWRFTYHVPVGHRDPATGWAWRAGGTLAIRDARIRLTQPGLQRTFDNVGAVPVLYLATSRAFTGGWTVEAELDGAPGPNGAGFWDGALRLRRDIAPGWSVAAGVRHLRGGVDNDEVMNRVAATSATVSLRASF